ncbi:MAG: mechanosensitive ion channel family protein, partial [Paludibacteraceae bacterium]|nr:mechanosensitive ion channel family protein [Paludibacteraceae bacterium]
GIENNVSAVFLNYQDSALEINFIYYIKKSYDVFQVQNDVNFDILRNYNANKIDFAFPTQTIFIEK